MWYTKPAHLFLPKGHYCQELQVVHTPGFASDGYDLTYYNVGPPSDVNVGLDLPQ